MQAAQVNLLNQNLFIYINIGEFMSAFTQGFQIGFLGSMFNNMFNPYSFGGFWGNPFSCCNYGFMGGFFPSFNVFSFPTFSMPSFTGYSGFYEQPYPQIQFPNINDSIFAQNNFFYNTTPYANVDYTSFSTYSGGVSDANKPQKEETSAHNYDAETLKAKWQTNMPNLQLSDEFYRRIIEISQKIECDPNDLMGVINIESAFKPNAQNKSTNATGLIQFMPDVAKEYGTTVDELKNMPAERQLDYVEQYFVKNKKSKKLNGRLSAGTLYALVFYPALVSGSVIKKGSDAYNLNKGLDVDNNGEITLSDLSAKVAKARA